jgi:hypothetical protein
MATPRFACHSDADIEANKSDVTPKTTKNSNETSAKTLRAYLFEKKLDTNFETCTIERLSDILTHFYIDVRTQEGKMYKANSLERQRHGLNRYLKSPSHSKKLDIIKDTAFNEANESFKLAMQELKAASRQYLWL